MQDNVNIPRFIIPNFHPGGQLFVVEEQIPVKRVFSERCSLLSVCVCSPASHPVAGGAWRGAGDPGGGNVLLQALCPVSLCPQPASCL